MSAAKRAGTKCVPGTVRETADAYIECPAGKGSSVVVLRLEAVLVRSLEVLLSVCLVAELLVLVSSSLGRSFFGHSIPWSLEVAQLALTCLMFLGAALAYGRGRQVAVSALQSVIPSSWIADVEAATDWGVLWAAAITCIASIAPLNQSGASDTAVLKISQYWYFFPLTLSAAITVMLAMLALARQARGRILPVVRSGFIFFAVVLGLLLWQVLRGTFVGSGPAILLTILLMVIILAVGVPIAFVLTAGGILYFSMTGSIHDVTQVPIAMQSQGDSFVLLGIPFFILAGSLMTVGGLTQPLMDFFEALIGKTRGGLYHMIIGTMIIFAGISGSKLADVASVGSATQASMRRGGYDAAETTAVLSAATVMGETIPPSLALIILGSATSVSITSLFAAGIMPAILLATLLALYVAWRHPSRTDLDFSPRAKMKATVRAAPAFGIPVILGGGIISGVTTPTEASAYAVVYSAFLAIAFYRTIGIPQIVTALRETVVLSGVVLFLIAATIPFARALTLGNIPQWVASGVARFGTHGSVIFMLLTIVALWVMGQVLEGTPAILVFGPLLVPLAPSVGLSMVQYSVVFLISLGLGTFTPPIGIGLYVAAGVMGTTVEATTRRLAPYLLVITAGILVVAFVPSVALFIPRMLGLSI